MKITEVDVKKEKTLRYGWMIGVWAILPASVSFFLGKSHTLLADLIKRICETLVLFFSWVAFKKGLRGETEKYHYGHGKLEDLVSLFFGQVILLSAGVIVFIALQRMSSPRPHGNLYFGILVALVDAIVNGYFWKRNHALARLASTPLIESQWRLYKAKTVVNVCVLASLVLCVFLGNSASATSVDVVGSFVVALYLMQSAYGLLKKSIVALLDRAVDDSFLADIVDQVDGELGEGIDVLRTKSRSSGGRVFVEVIVGFPGGMALHEINQKISMAQQRAAMKWSGLSLTLVPVPSPR